MKEPRANASSLILENSDKLYAFGGYNNNYNSSAVVSSIECLDTKNTKRGWQIISLELDSTVKACNYMHYISD